MASIAEQLIAASSASSNHTFDVVIVGAGIIGMAIARQFLISSDLSVAIIDKDVPCSGATGAGQGSIWRVHKTPEMDIWELTIRSHKLWETLSESLNNQGLDPSQVLGWKKNGSLIVGQTAEESSLLKRRVKKLRDAGLEAEYLTSHDLLIKEPALVIGEEGGAAFLPDDYQLDARRATEYIEGVNRQFAATGRYTEFFHHPVTSLIRSTCGRRVEAVQTTKVIVHSRKTVIVAAGCWTGSLVKDLFRDSDTVLSISITPRKGHLLVLENFSFFKLNYGLMEIGYIDHKPLAMQGGNSDLRDIDEEQLSVSMLATMDPFGNLVLGSSRQFSGFNTEVDEFVVNYIWKRAGDFFPKLRELSLDDFQRKVRVGLRPHMADGKPVIGPVPFLSNLFIAAGHEGEGLTLALGTAEMVADMVLGNPGVVNPSPFAVEGRCC